MLSASAILEYAILSEKNLRSEMPVTQLIGAGLDKIIELCRQELLEQAAKAQGGTTLLKRTKTAQKMLQGVEEHRIPICGATVRTAPDGTHYQTFNTGYYGFMLNIELQGLPQGDSTKSLDMRELIQNTESQMTEREEVEVDLAAIKAHIVEYKALNKGQRNIPDAVWKLGNHGYNAQYILDCFTVLGGDIKFYHDPNRPLSNAILESENGKCLLLPVKMK